MLHDLEGVFGLVANEKDVAVRVAGEVDRRRLEAQLQLALGDRKATLRQATAGLSWWRLGPLNDADVFRLPDLIALLGLQPHRDEIRLGKAGPFRRVAFFAATGSPSRTSLDDGGWGHGCSARLTPALPPPRPTRTTTSTSRPSNAIHPPQARRVVMAPSVSSPDGGKALPDTSTWAGPRRSPPAAHAVDADADLLVQDTRRSRRAQRTADPPSAKAPSPTGAAPPLDALAMMAIELREVRLELGQLRKELAAARQENDQLRRQLGSGRTPPSRPDPVRTVPTLHTPVRTAPSAVNAAAPALQDGATTVPSFPSASAHTPPASPVRPYSDPDRRAQEMLDQDEMMADAVHLGLHPRDVGSPDNRKVPRRAASAGAGRHDL